MFNYEKVGDIEILKQVKMPDATKTILMEILAQNRMILETNCLTMRLLGQPMMFIAKDIIGTADNNLNFNKLRRKNYEK